MRDVLLQISDTRNILRLLKYPDAREHRVQRTHIKSLRTRSRALKPEIKPPRHFTPLQITCDVVRHILDTLGLCAELNRQLFCIIPPCKYDSAAAILKRDYRERESFDLHGVCVRVIN